MGITVRRLLFKEHRKSEKSVEIDFLKAMRFIEHE